MGHSISGDDQSIIAEQKSMNSDTYNISKDPKTSMPHVLAVDDSITDRKLIEKLLKISSYQVTVVDSGRRALEFLGLGNESNNTVQINKSKVDMIITDYSMPGMTGYELLRKIKESSKLKEIPVVIMSSENVPSRMNRCVDEGAEDFILKPVQLSDVKQLMKMYRRPVNNETIQECQLSLETTGQ